MFMRNLVPAKPASRWPTTRELTSILVEWIQRRSFTCSVGASLAQVKLECP
jgi:hypothetical protein